MVVAFVFGLSQAVSKWFAIVKTTMQMLWPMLIEDLLSL